MQFCLFFFSLAWKKELAKDQLIETCRDTDVVRIIYALHVPKDNYVLHA